MSRYGWRPPLPDQRDLMLADVVDLAPPALPRTFSFFDICPPIRNQLNIGSCTGYGVAADYTLASRLHGFASEVVNPSELFIYYETRFLQGTTSYDSGASVRDAVKALAKFGAPPEDLWPYIPSKFRVKPPVSVVKAGLEHQALEYRAVRQDAQEMMAAIAAGYPIIVGFSVYESLETPIVDRSGLVPMPLRSEKMLGGHCVLVIGYDVDHPTHRWQFRNSWGANWGQGGYGRMPTNYLTDRRLSGDFWTIRLTEG